MATRKTSKGIPLDSIVFPTDAVGLTRLDPKLATSEKAAWLLGLGYPHGVFVTNEPLPAFADAAAFRKALPRVGLMPRDAVVRWWALDEADDDEASQNEALKNPKPPKLSEEIKMLLSWGKAWQLWNLEAQFGSEVVATEFVNALSKCKAKDFQSKLDRVAGVIGAVHYTLLRVPKKTEAALRAKLKAKFKEVEKLDELWRPGEELDVMLNGRKGVERSGKDLNGEIYLSNIPFAADDPKWALEELKKQLKTLRPADRAVADPQFGVALGPAAVKLLKANLAKFYKDSRKMSEEALALFKA
jgi:hypothetical protein